MIFPHSSHSWTWGVVSSLGELVHRQLDQIAKDERDLRRLIPWLFHRSGKPIPYATLYDAWRTAARAAGYPGKLMYDFRRTAATRLDSTPAISRSVAMMLPGYRTDIMFRRYIQRHDERLVEAAKALTEHQAAKAANRRLEAPR